MRRRAGGSRFRRLRRVFDAVGVNKSVFARCGSAIDRRRRQGIRTHFDLAKACPVTGMALFKIKLGGREAIIGCPVSGSRKCVDDVLHLLSASFCNGALCRDCRDLWFAPARSSRRRPRRRDRRVPLRKTSSGDGGPSRDCRARLYSQA